MIIDFFPYSFFNTRVICTWYWDEIRRTKIHYACLMLGHQPALLRINYQRPYHSRTLAGTGNLRLSPFAKGELPPCRKVNRGRPEWGNIDYGSPGTFKFYHNTAFYEEIIISDLFQLSEWCCVIVHCSRLQNGTNGCWWVSLLCI